MRSSALLRKLVWCLLIGVLCACQPSVRPEREVFDKAEEAYRQGNYDLAVEHYETFRKSFPDHQLTPLAEKRIANIERELSVIMRRRNSPRPIYLRPVSVEESSRDSGGVVKPLPGT